jgi:hypothetical protein
MSLTITYDPTNDFSVLTDDDERVCIPYLLNYLPQGGSTPIQEKRNSKGVWEIVKRMTAAEFEAWCDVKDKSGKPRIPRV